MAYTAKTSTGEMTFPLALVVVTVIPLEIGISSFRTATHSEMENEMVLQGELDLLDERRTKVELRYAVYK